ncbi:MAG: ABC transporter substrate-binding protein [Armatimonadota bacterium]
MTQRTKLAVLILAVAMVAVLLGCPKSQPGDIGELPEPPEPVPGAEEPVSLEGPVKIGAIFSVTGRSAPLGVPEKRTAQMLAEQLNEQGGILGQDVEVIVKDDKSQPTEAALAAQDLIENEKVTAIIGPSTTPNTMAIVDICQDAEVPLVSCAAGAPITNPVKKWVFAVPQTDVLAVAKIIEYLKVEDISSVATIYAANGYGESGQQQLEEQLPEAGIELLASESFGGEDTDMTAQLTRIKAQDPEAVICWGTNPGPATVAKDMNKLGMDMPLLQSHGVANQKFIELGSDAVEGVMLPAGRLIVYEEIPEDDPQKELLEQYASDFKEAYGESADTFGGHAYDAFHIVAEAIKRAETTDHGAVRDEIEATEKFVGTAGIFTYSPEDHNGLTKDAFVWVKITNGKWTLAESMLQ